MLTLKIVNVDGLHLFKWQGAPDHQIQQAPALCD